MFSHVEIIVFMGNVTWCTSHGPTTFPCDVAGSGVEETSTDPEKNRRPPSESNFHSRPQNINALAINIPSYLDLDRVENDQIARGGGKQDGFQDAKWEGLLMLQQPKNQEHQDEQFSHKLEPFFIGFKTWLKTSAVKLTDYSFVGQFKLSRLSWVNFWTWLPAETK